MWLLRVWSWWSDGGRYLAGERAQQTQQDRGGRRARRPEEGAAPISRVRRGGDRHTDDYRWLSPYLALELVVEVERMGLSYSGSLCRSLLAIAWLSLHGSRARWAKKREPEAAATADNKRSCAPGQAEAFDDCGRQVRAHLAERVQVHHWRVVVMEVLQFEVIFIRIAQHNRGWSTSPTPHTTQRHATSAKSSTHR